MLFLSGVYSKLPISSGIKQEENSAMNISENHPITVSDFSSAISTEKSSMAGNLQVRINVWLAQLLGVLSFMSQFKFLKIYID